MHYIRDVLLSEKILGDPLLISVFTKISPRSSIALRNVLASFYDVRGFKVPTPPRWKIISLLLVFAIIRICRPLLLCPEDVPRYGDRRTVDVFRINYVT
jgi:hypothetical protein